MTGEITLRGRVFPVGGVKEKVLAAHRAGIKTVLLPRRNEKDLFEIRKKVLGDLQLIYVDTMDDVLKLALEPANVVPKRIVRKPKPKVPPSPRRPKQPPTAGRSTIRVRG